MKTRVQRWGNSLAVRIPRPLADEAGLKDNSPVEISLRDKQLVVVPLAKPAYTLETLLAQVTEANLHGVVDSGTAVGGEVW
jgi:antitoxin MazE